MTHYFDINIDVHRGSYSELAGIMYSAFHGAMKCYGPSSPVATGFPKWQQHIEPNKATFGNIFRFFGDQIDLSVWFNNSTLEKLEESGLITVNPIKQIPENCPHVRYIRDRRIEKAQKYGTLDQVLAYPPVAFLKSATNKKTYPIRVRMEKAEANPTGNFSAYGLSSGEAPGTVPYF